MIEQINPWLKQAESSTTKKKKKKKKTKYDYDVFNIFHDSLP